MRRIALVLMVWAGSGMADDWVPLRGDDLTGFLNDQMVEYDAAWQRFYASGRTLYNAGQESWGYWTERDGQYCSQWPPSGIWDCYGVERRGEDEIRFVGKDGSISKGRRRKSP